MAPTMSCGPAKVVFSPTLGCMVVKLLGEGPSTEVPHDSSPEAPRSIYESECLASGSAGSASTMSGASGTSTPCRLEGADDSGSDSPGEAAAAAQGRESLFLHEAAKQAPGSGAVATTTPTTTLMLRKVPQTWSRDMLTGLLDSKGFSGLYDFVYLPMNIKIQQNVSYAFLNFASPDAAERFVEVFHGLDVGSSEEVFQVCLSEVQGRDANVRRYQNSPIMGQSVLDLYKPALFCGGRRVPFPAPTKRLKGMRLRMGNRPENAATGA